MKLSIASTGIDTVSFEHASVTDSSKSFRLIAIYRPPPSARNGFTHSQFLDEFHDFLGAVSDSPGKPLIMGDMNVHVNNPLKPDVPRYIASITEHGYEQYVHGPTHKGGNTLDHVICHPDDDLLVPDGACSVSRFRYGSDHHIIQCKVNRSKPPPQRRMFTSRSFKDMNMDMFTADLSDAMRQVALLDDPNIRAVEYNRSIRQILDDHCPTTTRSRKLIRNPEWYRRDHRRASGTQRART